jgi:hypothetical protein
MPTERRHNVKDPSLRCSSAVVGQVSDQDDVRKNLLWGVVRRTLLHMPHITRSARYRNMKATVVSKLRRTIIVVF